MRLNQVHNGKCTLIVTVSGNYTYYSTFNRAKLMSHFDLKLVCMKIFKRSIQLNCFLFNISTIMHMSNDEDYIFFQLYVIQGPHVKTMATATGQQPCHTTHVPAQLRGRGSTVQKVHYMSHGCSWKPSHSGKHEQT